MLIYPQFIKLGITIDILLSARPSVGTQVLCCYNSCTRGSRPRLSAHLISAHTARSDGHAPPPVSYYQMFAWCLSALECHSITIRGIRNRGEFNAFPVSLHQCHHSLVDRCFIPHLLGRIIVRCNVLSQMIPSEGFEPSLVGHNSN